MLQNECGACRGRYKRKIDQIIAVVPPSPAHSQIARHCRIPILDALFIGRINLFPRPSPENRPIEAQVTTSPLDGPGYRKSFNPQKLFYVGKSAIKNCGTFGVRSLPNVQLRTEHGIRETQWVLLA